MMAEPFPQAIARELQRVDLVRQIHYRDEIDSTSSFLQRLIGERSATVDAPDSALGDLHGTLCVADLQTAGRGRHGRCWHGAPGRSLLFSILLRSKAVAAPGLVPAAGAVAVARAMAALRPRLDPAIKWPNDVLIAGRKAAGVLVESLAGWLVLGVGVNVAQGPGDFPAGLPAISMAMAFEAQGLGAPPCRAALLRAILLELTPLLEAPDGPTLTLELFRRLDTTIGQQVSIRRPQSDAPPIEGLALGLDVDGALIVRLDHGPVLAVHSGEATLAPRDPAPPASAPSPRVF